MCFIFISQNKNDEKHNMTIGSDINLKAMTNSVDLKSVSLAINTCYS